VWIRMFDEEEEVLSWGWDVVKEGWDCKIAKCMNMDGRSKRALVGVRPARRKLRVKIRIVLLHHHLHHTFRIPLVAATSIPCMSFARSCILLTPTSACQVHSRRTR
jgi:hypothetical protein